MKTIAPGLRLRDETPEDEPFLRGLFLAVRGPEFAATGLPPAAIEQLMATQFILQSSQYRATFRDADWHIVEHQGVPVGRLYVAREMAGRALFDISLLPDVSGRGIGGKLIDHVLAEAQAAGRTVRLTVRTTNPARRLYLRKGFVETGMEGADIGMLWRPS